MLGLVGHTEHGPKRSNTHDSSAAFQNDHAFVVLTRYHLGNAYLEQDCFPEAREALAKAWDSTLPERRGCSMLDGSRLIMLHFSITLSLCRCYIEQDPPDTDKAKGLALSVIQPYQTQAPQSDADQRLVIEALLSLARTAHMARYLATSYEICNHILHLIKELGLYKEDDMDEADLGVFRASFMDDIALHAEAEDGSVDERAFLAEFEEGSLLNKTKKESLSDNAGEKLFYKKAKDLRGKVCTICEKLEGDSSVRYLTSIMALSDSYQKVKNSPKAEEELKKAFERFRKTLGEYATKKTLKACQALGRLYLADKKMDKAREYHERAFQGFQKRHGTSNSFTSGAAYELGTVYFQSFRFT